MLIVSEWCFCNIFEYVLVGIVFINFYGVIKDINFYFCCFVGYIEE